MEWNKNQGEQDPLGNECETSRYEFSKKNNPGALKVICFWAGSVWIVHSLGSELENGILLGLWINHWVLLNSLLHHSENIYIT